MNTRTMDDDEDSTYQQPLSDDSGTVQEDECVDGDIPFSGVNGN